MSKSFEQWYVDTEFDPMAYDAMQASWNAALEHAARICDSLKIASICNDVRQAATAIRKEKTVDTMLKARE